MLKNNYAKVIIHVIRMANTVSETVLAIYVN